MTPMEDTYQIEVKDEFVRALHRRINRLRPSIVIEHEGRKKGYRFKNNDIITDNVVGVVLNANMKTAPAEIPVEPTAVGLQFEKEDVTIGRYDRIILTVLENLTILDFEIENSVDFH